MLLRMLKLAELLAAEGDIDGLRALDACLAGHIRKNSHFVPDNDGNTPNPWRRNMDYAPWENSPYYGSVSEFMKKFPGGIKDWVEWRRKTKKERNNQWDIKERKAHLLNVMKVANEEESEKDMSELPEKGPKATTVRELVFMIPDPIKRLNLLKLLMDKDILSYKWDRAKWEDEGKAKEYWTQITNIIHQIDDIKNEVGVAGPIVSNYGMRVANLKTARYGDDVNPEEDDSPALRAVTLLINEKIKELRDIGLDDKAIKQVIESLLMGSTEMNAKDALRGINLRDIKMLDQLEKVQENLAALQKFDLAEWFSRLKDKNVRKQYEKKVEQVRKQIENIDRLLYSHNDANDDNELIEELAELEHEQWAHWTKYMIKHLTDEDIEQWKKQIKTEYKNLTEEEKDGDREWARKVINILKKNKVKLAHYIPEGKDDVEGFEKEPHLYSGDMDKYKSIEDYLNKFHNGQDAKDAAFDAAKDFVRYWRLLLKRKK